MRMLGAALIFLVSLGTTRAETVHDITLSVTDLSSEGSPLGVLGTASFHVVTSENVIQTEPDFAVEVTNISSKPILAFEYMLDAVPDYGPGISRWTWRDHFFQLNSLFMPGSQDVFQSLLIGPTISMGIKAGVNLPTRQPKANLTVLFVEFADGTTFGNSEWGDKLSASRAATLHEFRIFMQAYDSGREADLFVAISNAIDRTYPEQTIIELTNLKSILDSTESGSALAYIQNALAAAEQYKTLM